ncbi:hypothetical protein ABTE37_20230, partial [Acinetobacter baumannii]
LLADAGQRRALLSRIDVAGGGAEYRASVEEALDEIASALEDHLDIDALVALATAERSAPRTAEERA